MQETFEPAEARTWPPLAMPDLSPEARRRRAALRHAAPGLRPTRCRGRRQARASFGCCKRSGPGPTTMASSTPATWPTWRSCRCFPFFITVGGDLSAIGEQAQREASVNAFLTALPPMVADVIGAGRRDVIERAQRLAAVDRRAGRAVDRDGSLIETIRDILRRAYGTPARHRGVLALPAALDRADLGAVCC
jgi:membrane protein